MIEKTFIYPRYNFTDLAPIRVVINEENGAILLNIEDLDFINWLTYELMPNIIRGINQFNMPVEVVIKDDE